MAIISFIRWIMNKNQLSGFYIIIGIVLFLLAVTFFVEPTSKSETISYSKFVKKVELNQIEKVTIQNLQVVVYRVGV